MRTLIGTSLGSETRALGERGELRPGDRRIDATAQTAIGRGDDSLVPDDWPAHVVDAVAAELASRIGLAMSANGKVVQAMKALQTNYLSMAIEHDASEQAHAGSKNNRYVSSRI